VYISAAIRHIFVHGHLAANANGAKPKKIAEGCMLVSDFLLDFMDAEFTKSMEECEKRIEDKEASLHSRKSSGAREENTA